MITRTIKVAAVAQAVVEQAAVAQAVVEQAAVAQVLAEALDQAAAQVDVVRTHTHR